MFGFIQLFLKFLQPGGLYFLLFSYLIIRILIQNFVLQN